MRKYLFTILLCVGCIYANGQCLTIHNILVDACGEPEGANEMVRFEVGAFDLNVQDIVFDWPNNQNQFLGWCLSPAKTAQLNATIVSSCGFLQEPTDDILPAGSQVVVITSTDFDVAANSFEGLIDTFYILYQCAGNTTGHFSNSATSTRTLSVEVTAAGCTSTETASYIGTSLVGGDGGLVEYIGGNSIYSNTGCDAPIPNYSPDWSFTDLICQDYGDVVLSDLAANPPVDAVVSWQGNGVSGDIFNPVGLIGEQSITYTLEVPGGCVPLQDSTLTFFVDTLTITEDTIFRCEALLFEGNLITSSQVIEVSINNFDEYGCDELIYRFVDIHIPDYSVSPSDITIDSGDSLVFEIDADENMVFAWSNTLGDSCASSCGFELSPTDHTVYTFALTDTSTGCTILDQIRVHLIYYSELALPNTFTPNGDGQNDIYRAYGKDIRDFSLQIFDRFGGVIFYGKSLDEGWDGTSRGMPVESGYYYGVLRAIGKDERNFEIFEKVRLVR